MTFGKFGHEMYYLIFTISFPVRVQRSAILHLTPYHPIGSSGDPLVQLVGSSKLSRRRGSAVDKDPSQSRFCTAVEREQREGVVARPLGVGELALVFEVVLGQEALLQGPVVELGQEALLQGPVVELGQEALLQGPVVELGQEALLQGPVVELGLVLVVEGDQPWFNQRSVTFNFLLKYSINNGMDLQLGVFIKSSN